MSNFFQNSNKNLCCGCRACEQICPEGAIHMEEDKEGFLYPVIDEEKCTKCGMCVKVCPIKDGGYNNKSAFKNPNVYAAYHRDEQILNNSTSGGAFTAVVQAFCDKDYVIFGAIFDENIIIRHTFVTDIKNISKFRWSKYVQSDIGDSFNKARKFLKEGKKVLFSGTPCQIAGLKEFLGKDYENLLTIDLVCHGVPSPGVFERYKQYLTQKYKKNIVDLNFRDKSKKGWLKPYVIIKFEDGRVLRTFHDDNSFIVGYYKGYYLRPICHSCPFVKMPRVSDITLADFWGIKEIDPTFYNKNGTSLILVNTEKAEKIFSISKNYLLAVKENIEKAKKFNSHLYRSEKANQMRNQFMIDIQNIKFENLKKKYLKPRSLIKKIASLILSRKIKCKIKRFLCH